jgi:hypothetical protein
MYKNPALQSFGPINVRIGERPEKEPEAPKLPYTVNGKGATREEYLAALNMPKQVIGVDPGCKDSTVWMFANPSGTNWVWKSLQAAQKEIDRVCGVTPEMLAQKQPSPPAPAELKAPNGWVP